MLRKVLLQMTLACIATGVSIGCVSQVQAANHGGKHTSGTSWSYRHDGLPIKTCHSNYYHPSRRHAAVATMSGKSSVVWANAGRTASASVSVGYGGTCYAQYKF